MKLKNIPLHRFVDMSGEDLRAVRKKSGLPQTQVGVKLGTTKQTINNWELDRYLDLDNKYKFLQLFDK